MPSFNKSKPLPEANGPFVPGMADVMLDYEKTGVFFRLYFPTEAKKGDPENAKRWYPWIPDDSYLQGFANVILNFQFLLRLAFWWFDINVIPAIYGGKPKTTEKLKCIILSHGLGATRFFYSNICCELASRGFLVAALEHRDGSACSTFYYRSPEDAKNKIRTMIPFERIELGKEHFEKRNKQVHYKAEECCKVVEFLQNLNKGIVPKNVLEDIPTSRLNDFKLDDLVGHLDTDNFGIIGHSFGGATALLALEKHSELKFGILLDPWMFSIKDEGLQDKLNQPLLFINTQTFHIDRNVNAMAKYLEKDNRKMFTILHTTHENQTDSVLLIGYWLNWFMKKLDPIKALKINNSLILNFINGLVGVPCSIDDCHKILEEEKENIESGLTKPWA